MAVLFEYVFGFRADVPRGTLTIDVRLLERYGVTAFPFGDADIDIEVAGEREGLANVYDRRCCFSCTICTMTAWKT